MATAPGASGNWIYTGNGQWSPAVQSWNEGQLNWSPTEGSFTSDPLISQNYAGSREQIYQNLFGRTPESIQSQFGINPDQYLSQAMQGVTPYTIGQGSTSHIGSKPLLSMLEAAGVDWRSDPNLVNYDQQATQQAIQQAQQTEAVNTTKVSPAQLAAMAASVWGGGYLLGTGLGAAQGLGSFSNLLANPSLTGAGGGAGSALGGAADAAWGVNQGAGMDFFDAWDLMGDPSAYGLGGGPSPAGDLSQYFTDFGSNFGPTGEGLYPTGAENFPGAWEIPGGSTNWLDLAKKTGNLFTSGGGDGGGGTSPWGTNPRGGAGGGGLLNSLFGGGGLGSGLGLAAVLGGLGYGYNKADFDTGRLESLYNQYNPNAMAGQYDLNTGLGRDALTSSLGRRGVLGSSFGNMDLTNYNTARDIGRQQLISGAVGPAAGIAGQILGADVAEQKLKNDLLGAGLYSIGRMFGPGGGTAGGGATPAAGGGGTGGNWWDSIAGLFGGGGNKSVATPPYFPTGNPLDIWNV